MVFEAVFKQLEIQNARISDYKFQMNIIFEDNIQQFRECFLKTTDFENQEIKLTILYDHMDWKN